MSKKCPKCGSNNVHLAATVPHALCVCFDCRHQWKNKYKPRKKTVFQKITASPEVLAPKLVYSFACYDRMGVYWKSTIVDDVGVDWPTKPEAIAATVARLKEVENG